MDDTISRQQAISRKVLLKDWTGKEHYAVLVTDIEQLPPIQPKRGKWNRLDMDTFNCNQCGATFVLNQGSEKMHFCPNCETDMREDNKKKMKSLKQVQRKEKIGTVYTTEKFAECISRGSFNAFDGVGFFHDGEQETNRCVWDYILTWDDVKDYPYVVWYNK